SVTSDMRDRYAQYPCGGFALFAKNIENPEQLLTFTEEMHALGNVRPVLCIDEEGGRVARLGNHEAFDVPRVLPMGTIRKTGNPEKAYEAGRRIGEYLRFYGLDVDFAPVADVNTNPRNPVIGDRAFGSEPETASAFVIRYLDGLHDAGIAGCIKHFPGHGDTATDTHTGYTETQKTWEELDACEMIPFRAGIGAGAEMVMTAHIAAPKVTGGDLPSTLSYTVLTEKLRGELGYDGVIITDALSMGAVTEQFSSGEASVRAFLAGADILLMPYDYPEAFEAVLAAVERGEITQERLDASVLRILRMKEAFDR
ncbi:MAG: glycoside hydrolase, partial [Clostridia bacterium]|nr:glycoside hydrolase [Clostridia bacterium]